MKNILNCTINRNGEMLSHRPICCRALCSEKAMMTEIVVNSILSQAEWNMFQIFGGHTEHSVRA